MKSQDDDIPKISLLRFFDLKNGGLSHITINFDSRSRRLLISMAETDCIALEHSSLQSLPSGLYFPQGDTESARCRWTERQKILRITLWQSSWLDKSVRVWVSATSVPAIKPQDRSRILWNGWCWPEVDFLRRQGSERDQQQRCKKRTIRHVREQSPCAQPVPSF